MRRCGLHAGPGADTTELRLVEAGHRLPPIASVTVDIVIPVFNEERALPGCIAVLHDYLHERFPFDWTITVVDNASTDSTRAVARDIAAWCPRVQLLALERRGKGHAVRSAWAASRADIVAYLDVDLSTDLDALLPLVAPLANGHSDLAIGSRLAPGARTVRSPKREFVSRGYNAVLRLLHGVRFSDAQCGFKAARTAVIRPLLPAVEDESWFFDTELLLLAEHNGLRVHEVPVDWVEDADSRVRVVGTAATNLRGTARLALTRASGAARVPGLPQRSPPRPIHPDAVLAPAGSGRGWTVLAAGLATAATLAVYGVFRIWCPPLVAAVLAIGLTGRLQGAAGAGQVRRGHLPDLASVLARCGLASAGLLALGPAPIMLEVGVLLAAIALDRLLLDTALRLAGRRRRRWRPTVVPPLPAEPARPVAVPSGPAAFRALDESEELSA